MNSIGIALKTMDVDVEENTGCPLTKVSSKHINDENSHGIKAEKVKLPSIDLHINIWKTNSQFFKKENHIYIDFGIKANFEYDDLNLFLPFQLTKDGWRDLGDVVSSDNRLLCSLFNKDVTAVKEGNGCYYNIKELDNPNAKGLFHLYVLGENNVTVKDSESLKGTWLDIKIRDHKEFDKDDYYYVRFRVELKENCQFAIRRNLSNSLIQAAFSKLDLYDLRINETRNLDKKVKEEFRDNHFKMANFSNIHVFFIAPIKVSIDDCGIHKDDSRIIESDIWRDYEPVNSSEQVFIGHHWEKSSKNIFLGSGGSDSKDEPFSKFNLFFTAKHPKLQLGTLFAYCFVVIIMGFIGSWLTTSSKDEFALIGISYKLWILIIMVLFILLWLLSGIRFKGSLYWKDK